MKIIAETIGVNNYIGYCCSGMIITDDRNIYLYSSYDRHTSDTKEKRLSISKHSDTLSKIIYKKLLKLIDDLHGKSIKVKQKYEKQTDEEQKNQRCNTTTNSEYIIYND